MSLCAPRPFTLALVGLVLAAVAASAASAALPTVPAWPSSSPDTLASTVTRVDPTRFAVLDERRGHARLRLESATADPFGLGMVGGVAFPAAGRPLTLPASSVVGAPPARAEVRDRDRVAVVSGNEASGASAGGPAGALGVLAAVGLVAGVLLRRMRR